MFRKNGKYCFSFDLKAIVFVLFVKTVLSTGKGACTGATTEPSSACGPRKFNMYYWYYDYNEFWSNYYVWYAIAANSFMNSYCNAFNLPSFLTDYSLQEYVDSRAAELRTYGVGFEPKKCYDPSTRSSTVCSVNDWQCLVKRDLLYYI